MKKKATSYEEDRQLTFDYYCKRILKNEAIDIQRNKQYMREKQVSFSELTPEQLNQLYTYDTYSTDYTKFQVLELDVDIKNDLLAEALNGLSDKKRNVVLLSYCFGYSDVEIAEMLNLVRRTVNDIRHNALKDLKERMEGKPNE